jgi:NAD(P) transhydrogenase subunit alpha
MVIEGFVALYIFMLASIAGFEVISKVPVILHTPLMSGSNFVSGLVIIGAMIALMTATNPLQQALGFIGVMMAAANAVGGYAATDRMLEMFKKKKEDK